MLWLDVKIGGKVVIGENIIITVERIKSKNKEVSLSIDAPLDVSVVREELNFKNKDQSNGQS